MLAAALAAPAAARRGTPFVPKTPHVQLVAYEVAGSSGPLARLSARPGVSLRSVGRVPGGWRAEVLAEGESLPALGARLRSLDEELGVRAGPGAPARRLDLTPSLTKAAFRARFPRGRPAP